MFGQAFEHVAHVIQVVKGIQAVGVDFQFTLSLRTAQHQWTKQGEAFAVQAQCFVGQVFVLGCPATPGFTYEAE